MWKSWKLFNILYVNTSAQFTAELDNELLDTTLYRDCFNLYILHLNN